MADEPFLHHHDNCDWETRPGRTDGVRWKLLVDADRMPSHGLSLGVLEFPPGTVLAPHRHSPQEVYLIQAGKGELRIGDETRDVGPGTVVYIPENHLHGIANTGDTPLTLMWIFPTDTWAEVEYLFE